MTTLFSNDPEVRRLNFGWFGEPWPSSICFDDTCAVREDMRIPTPIGDRCLSCAEIIREGDQGQAMPLGGGYARITYSHRECQLREVLGPLKHVRGECTGVGQCHDDTGMSAREEALAVWDWVHEHGI